MNPLFRLFLLAQAAILSVSCLFSQDCSASKLALEFSVEQKDYKIIEPLFYTLKLINNGGKDMIVSEPWNSFNTPLLEIKTSDSTGWAPLKYAGKGPSSLLIPAWENYDYKRKLRINSGDTVAHDFIWVPFFDKEEFDRFSEGRTVHLRANYSPCENETLLSNEIRISFSPYTDNMDQNAFEWLRQLKKPSFMYEVLVYSYQGWGFYTYRNKHTISDAENFIANFPASKFSPWVQLHLAYCYWFGLNEDYNNAEPQLEKAKALLKPLKSVPDTHFQEERQRLLNGIEYREKGER